MCAQAHRHTAMAIRAAMHSSDLTQLFRKVLLLFCNAALLSCYCSVLACLWLLSQGYCTGDPKKRINYLTALSYVGILGLVGTTVKFAVDLLSK